MNKQKLLNDYEARWGRISEAMARAEIKSQRALARRLGIEGPSVNGWAQGKHLPEMRHMLKLANWSSMCVEYLWTGREPKYPLDPDLREMVATFESLPAERRAEILRFARFRDEDSWDK